MAATLGGLDIFGRNRPTVKPEARHWRDGDVENARSDGFPHQQPGRRLCVRHGQMGPTASSAPTAKGSMKSSASNITKTSQRSMWWSPITPPASLTARPHPLDRPQRRLSVGHPYFLGWHALHRPPPNRGFHVVCALPGYLVTRKFTSPPTPPNQSGKWNWPKSELNDKRLPIAGWAVRRSKSQAWNGKPKPN